MLRRFLLTLACLALAVPLWAHPAPFSFLDVRVLDDRIEGSIVMHVEDLAHDLNIELADSLLEPDVVARERQRILALVGSRLSLSIDAPLALEWTGAAPDVERHAVRVSFRAATPRPGSLLIGARMFTYDPVHQTFVNIYDGDNLRHQLILNNASEPYRYYTDSTQGTLAVLGVFIPSGIEHILIGPDHILFLIALLLPGGGWRRVLLIVSAFTVGHSITLSLAALNLLNPPARLIEPAIALSIVYAGADNLTRGAGRDVRVLVAGLFGLVHGFGFANVLREFGLPSEALGWSLFSFNLGVELGQLLIVIPAAVVLAAIQERHAPTGALLIKAGSVIVILAGAWWFVERTFLTPV